MAVNFPDSPTNGQLFNVGSSVYSYNSTKGAWVDIGASSELSNYLQVANSTSFATTSQLDNYLQVANSSTAGTNTSVVYTYANFLGG